MSKQNPLVAAPEEVPNEPPDLTDDLLGDDAVLTGPSEPGGVVNEHRPSQERWPRVTVPEQALVTVAGLHGGAGTSTVAALFDDAASDAGVGFPVAGGWKRPLPTLNVVMVARTHAAGLAAAEEFARQWGAGELMESRLLGLVLVDDGPKLYDSQRRAVKRLLKMTPVGAHIPWVETWRIQSPDLDNLPRRLRKIVERFIRQAHQGYERNEN